MDVPIWLGNFYLFYTLRTYFVQFLILPIGHNRYVLAKIGNTADHPRRRCHSPAEDAPLGTKCDRDHRTDRDTARERPMEKITPRGGEAMRGEMTDGGGESPFGFVCGCFVRRSSFLHLSPLRTQSTYTIVL